MRTIVLSVLLAIIGTVVFSIDRLSFASYALFTGPLSFFDERLVASVLLVSLSFSLVVVHRTAVRLSSERAAWSALVLMLVSVPVLLAPLSVSLGFLAVPLLLVFIYQLSTRRYRLVSVAIPIAGLFVLGFGHYALFVLAALLVASPLRPDPDPRLGDLFIVSLLAFIVSGAFLPSSFSVERALPFGLVFIALVVFAVYRVVSQGSRRADPIVALALSSAVLFFLGDPIAALTLTIAGGVLSSIAFESIFRFFDVSNIRFKRSIAFSLVVFIAALTLTQSLWFAVLDERMDPQLAASMRSVERGTVAVDERFAPALRYYSHADVVAIPSSEADFIASSRLSIPVLSIVDDRYERIVLFEEPSLVLGSCFSVVEYERLWEVRIRCSLS